jgi:hypothetical protein
VKTAKELVYEQQPNAVAKRYRDANVVGQPNRYEPARWYIYTSPELGAQTIGDGRTEDDAWCDAAAKLAK